MKPQMALYHNWEERWLSFEKYLWFIQRKETSLKVLRWTSNEAWGISRNVDVTLVTSATLVQRTLTIMTLITDLIEISTFFTFYTSPDNFS